MRAPLAGRNDVPEPSIPNVLFDSLHSERVPLYCGKEIFRRRARSQERPPGSRYRFVNPTGGVGLHSFVKREGNGEWKESTAERNMPWN